MTYYKNAARVCGYFGRTTLTRVVMPGLTRHLFEKNVTPSKDPGSNGRDDVLLDFSKPPNIVSVQLSSGMTYYKDVARVCGYFEFITCM